MGHLKPTIITLFFPKIKNKVIGYPIVKKSRTLPHEIAWKYFIKPFYQPSQLAKAWNSLSKK
jgi:hypothetical protein